MARKTRKAPLMETTTLDLSNFLYRVAIYTRLSTETQKEIDDSSLARQRQICMDFLKDKPDMVVYDTYMKLYEDFKAGKLTMEEFRVQKAEKAREDEAITSQMEELSAELTRLNADREQPMESKPSVSMEIGDRLTPELLKAFVEKVIIAPNGEPEIVFQFKDTFQ